jgi:thiol-disulfide isomerase/thioredoxin
MSKPHFTLYSRSYCHLCDDMLQALLVLQAPDENVAGRAADRFNVELIDVDADPELVAKYDELVPVLVGNRDGQEPMQLCHYFLDVELVKRFISEGA